MAVGEARVPTLSDQSVRHHDTPKLVLSHAELNQSATIITSLMAGACAGALAKTAIAPMDRTKIIFQASLTPYSWKAAFDFVVQTARYDGVLALWRGNSATMARIVPYAAIQFTAHEQCKKMLCVDTPVLAKQHPIKHLIAGSLAGVISQSATYPLDMARARMAVSTSVEYATLRAVFTKVAKQEGVITLYRGYPATILGVIPYAGVSFYTYDTLKHTYLELFGKPQSAMLNVVFGGTAGALAQTASYPLDIVRRRMQTSRRRPDGTYPHSTIIGTLRYVYRMEGVRGFFKGLSMNWVKGPIAVGISFASYDAIKTALRDLAIALHS